MYPIKVLYFVAEYHRFTGSQRQLLMLIKALPKDLVETMVAFPGEGLCVEAYREAGIKVIIIQAPSSLNQFGKALLNAPSLKKGLLLMSKVLPYSLKILRLMREWNVQILHCNSARALLMAGIAPALTKYPVIWHIRGQTHVMGRILRWTCEVLASSIVTNADVLKGELSKHACKKTITIYDAVDITQIGKLAQQKSNTICEELLTHGRPVIAMFASLTPFKGYHYLIEAAKLITANWPCDPPLFIGIGSANEFSAIDEEYASYLNYLIKDYNLSNFIFLGWQSNPFPYYNLSDIVVLPSVDHDVLRIGEKTIQVKGSEGFPNTICEAMAFGKPVVGTRNAGITEQVINGETGILVPQRDSRALAEAILLLLNNPSLCKCMGEKGEERAKTLFTIEREINQILDLYRSLLE